MAISRDLYFLKDYTCFTMKLFKDMTLLKVYTIERKLHPSDSSFQFIVTSMNLTLPCICH